MENEPPTVAVVARMVASTMVAKDPVASVGFAVVKDENEKTIYTVAVVMGSENAEKFAEYLRTLEATLGPVDIDFEGL